MRQTLRVRGCRLEQIINLLGSDSWIGVIHFAVAGMTMQPLCDSK